MNVLLTGLKHHDVQTIAESIVPKNSVTVKHEPELDIDLKKKPDRTCDGLAWRCECKGLLIGYIPLIRTLRKYYNEATSDAERESNRQRGLATKAVRDQLRIELENLGTDCHTVKVSGLLYAKEGQFLEYPQYSDLCQSEPEEAKKWTLVGVSVCFPSVDAF